MAFSRTFHQGANRNQIQDAMNPFKYLIPSNSKDAVDCTISIPHPVKQEELGHKYRLEHQVVAANQSQGNEWPVPSESRGSDDSV